MVYSLQPHGLKHTRVPCPLLPSRVCSNSCPLSWWCHSTFSSSAALVSFCLQCFPASGPFPVSWLFASSGWSIGASISASVLPNYGLFLLELTDLISLLSKGLSRVFSSTMIQSMNSLALSFIYGPTLTSVCDYWKNHTFDYTDLCRQSDASAF